MATCPHGKEVCEACAKFLTVAEAVKFREDHPGTKQREAAEMAGVSRAAIEKAELRSVTKRDMSQNVTDPLTTDGERNDLQQSCQVIYFDPAEIPPAAQAAIDTLQTLSRSERSYIRVWIGLNWPE